MYKPKNVEIKLVALVVFIKAEMPKRKYMMFPVHDAYSFVEAQNHTVKVKPL